MNCFNDTFISILKSFVKKCNYENKLFFNIDNIKNIDDVDDAFDFLDKTHHKYIAMFYDTLSETPAFLKIKSKDGIINIINLLLNKEIDSPLYPFTNRCLIAPPYNNKRTYGWHHEIFYTIPESRFIQTWAPLLRDTTIENGTIFIAKKSHKHNIKDIKLSWTEKEDGATQIIVDNEIMEKYEKLQIPMKVNDIMFFGGKTIHKSGNNTSNKYRFSLVGMYHDIDYISFNTPNLTFNYRGFTPKEYYDNIFSHNEKLSEVHKDLNGGKKE